MASSSTSSSSISSTSLSSSSSSRASTSASSSSSTPSTAAGEAASVSSDSARSSASRPSAASSSAAPSSSSDLPAAAIALNNGCSPGAWTGTRATGTSSVRAFLPRRPRRPPAAPDSAGAWFLRPGAELPSTGSVCSTMPRPLHSGHVVENASTSPVPSRFRVNCTRPSEVTSETWCRVRSRASASVSLRRTRSRLDSRTMSMKSITTMPPMSRSRSWRTISSAASRLFLVTVCSRLPPAPVNLPVLTSTTVIASVRSITRVPPEGSQTLRSMALASCSSIRCTAKMSGPSPPAGSYFVSFDNNSGATPSTYPVIVSQAASPETMSPEKSSLNRSRITLTRTSGSSYRATAAPARLPLTSSAFSAIVAHRSCSLVTSARMSSDFTPSDAVLMITPASAGTTSRRISLSRWRSVSGSLRLIPVEEAPGT